MNSYLDKHVIDDEEEVDGFRSHDKDVKATGWLVQTHTLKLTAELESSWRKPKVTENMVLIRVNTSAWLSHSSWTWTTYRWLWSPAWVWQCRRGWRWRCTQWTPQRPLGCTHPTRCCHKGTEGIYKEKSKVKSYDFYMCCVQRTCSLCGYNELILM